MKRIVVSSICLLALVGCGGGSGSSGDSSISSEGGVNAPTIESVAGTGSDGVLLDKLLVSGTNFDETMEVFLVNSGETETLAYTLESANKFTAALPANIEPGEFDLEVQNDFGKATAPLSLLQGEPGISLEHYYFCPGSSDLDSTLDEQGGAHAAIYEFSDGSMFISCESSILYTATLFWDYSTAVAFVPANLIESMGYVACIPMYVMGQYTPSSNSMRWALNADPGVYEDVTCSAVY